MKITPLGKPGTPMARVLHVQIKDKYDLAMTFLRAQEWYESPKFHHKLFTLEEYMRWYSKAYGKGAFTYPKDWSGFNVPSAAVTAIMNGPASRDAHPQRREKSDPMPTDDWMEHWSAAEDRLFYALCERGLVLRPDPTSSRPDWAFYRAPDVFYLVGTHGDADLPHEMAHGRFCVEPAYRREVLRIVRRHDTRSLAQFLLKLGYSKWTLEDEIHSYALTGWPERFNPTRALRDLRRELRSLA